MLALARWRALTCACPLKRRGCALLTTAFCALDGQVLGKEKNQGARALWEQRGSCYVLTDAGEEFRPSQEEAAAEAAKEAEKDAKRQKGASTGAVAKGSAAKGVAAKRAAKSGAAKETVKGGAAKDASKGAAKDGAKAAVKKTAKGTGAEGAVAATASTKSSGKQRTLSSEKLAVDGVDGKERDGGCSNTAQAASSSAAAAGGGGRKPAAYPKNRVPRKQPRYDPTAFTAFASDGSEDDHACCPRPCTTVHASVHAPSTPKQQHTSRAHQHTA